MAVLSINSDPGPIVQISSRSYGVLTTYPPTACGLATFSAALARGLLDNGASVGIVRVSDAAEQPDDLLVVAELHNGVPASVTSAATALNRFDIAIVQHEYGIYGGSDGDEVVDILRALTVPSIVVAHTVLERPSPHQRSVLEAVAEEANAIVVMSNAAQSRLRDHFDVDMSRVMMIPHGATLTTAITHEPACPMPDRPTMLTWGLLGPGKGIEWAIDALAQLRDLHPLPQFVVAGRTHPKVADESGEAYREMLIRRVSKAGLTQQVSFDPAYRDLPSLIRLIQSAKVVVLPYDSPDQATSGVLVDAIAAGRPVVATEFPHAVELLSTGAGLVVPRRDPDALAEALRRVLTEPGLVESMAAEAARLAPNLSWPVVAGRYDNVARGLLTERAALSA
jgi:glycosyltransferase involved in cell wall biosynthesis